MKLRSLVVIPICAQMGWSAVTLTIKDAKNQPIPGVSCGQGDNKGTSDPQGELTIPGPLGILRPVQGPKNSPLFQLPIASGEKASVTVFDSRGQRVASRDVRLGERFDFASANPGVFHIRVQGRDLSVSQSVVTMGQGMSFTGVSRDAMVGSGNSLRKVGGVSPVVCSKAGYATKTFMLNDGDTKVIGFGAPISRPFDPSKYPTYPGFNLELVEDFNTADWPNGLKWDANYVSNDGIWEPSDGGFDDNAVRFHADNITMKNDAMYLRIDTVRRASSFSKSEGDNCDPGAVGKEWFPTFCKDKKAPAKSWSGGEIRTKENNYRFGRYEITIDPPEKGTAPGQAEGFIAAMFTWRTPRDRNWRENDIEILGDSLNSFLTNIFYTNNQNPWSSNIGFPEPNTRPTGVILNTRASNTYAFEWLPKTVKWYVNGQLVRTLGEGGQALKRGMEISQLATKVVMNFWIMNSGAVGGKGTPQGFPIETKFDNFRYYRWDNDGDKVTYPEVECVVRTSINCPVK